VRAYIHRRGTDRQRVIPGGPAGAPVCVVRRWRRAAVRGAIEAEMAAY